MSKLPVIQLVGPPLFFIKRSSATGQAAPFDEKIYIYRETASWRTTILYNIIGL